ncbi:O-antigen ligase family protein [Priestia aryabhattai]|uniref:O-antigen ligase family protein n=1 Tax=Priestia TaxID=2800373 RepID=UPI00263B5989|nr:O-antigen ligase family protein [Priestia megaterium]MDN4861152.1 O-antigen ligase family protein [Priestia megaterium]
MLKVMKLICSNESIFVLFLYSGYYKDALYFLPIDPTILFLVLSVIFAFIRTMREKRIPKSFIRSLLCFLLFCLVLLNGLWYSESSVYGADKSLRFLIITGWSFLGIMLICRDTVSLSRFFKANLLFALIMTIGVVYTYFTQTIFVSYTTFTQMWGANYLAIGRTMGVAILIIISCVLYNKLLSKSLLLLLLPYIFALLIAGGRMPVLSVVLCLIGLTFYTFRFFKRDIRMHKGTMWLFITLIFLVLAIFTIELKTSYFQQTFSRMDLLVQSDKGSSVMGREERFGTAVKMIKDSFIIGEGTGSFPIYYENQDQKNYPHNMILEVFSELGIIGIIALSILFINGIKQFNKKQNPYHLTIVLCFVYLFLNANVSGDLNDNRAMFTFLGLLSISPWIEIRKSSTKEISKENIVA